MTQKSRRIEVVPYNPAWPGMFAVEAELLRQALGQNCVDIHHIGSTSVPGLSAKRDIDILCIIDELSASLALQNFGYVFKGELNIPFRFFFSKNISQSKVNLHVVEPGHSFIRLNLHFRDYLREHKDASLAYESLKYRLLEDPRSQQKSTPYFTDYTIGKDCFIKNILKKTNFTDLYINFCVHNNEWAAYHRILGHRPLTQPTHRHFVLYQGATIVAVAHVELKPGFSPTKFSPRSILCENLGRAVLKSFAVDEPYKSWYVLTCQVPFPYPPR